MVYFHIFTIRSTTWKTVGKVAMMRNTNAMCVVVKEQLVQLFIFICKLNLFLFIQRLVFNYTLVSCRPLTIL